MIDGEKQKLAMIPWGETTDEDSQDQNMKEKLEELYKVISEKTIEERIPFTSKIKVALEIAARINKREESFRSAIICAIENPDEIVETSILALQFTTPVLQKPSDISFISR